jgi:exosortase
MAPLKPSPTRQFANLRQLLQTEFGILALFVGIIASLYYWSWGGTVLAKSSVSLGFLALAAKYLWDDRKQLAPNTPILEEKALGYLLIVSGFAGFIYFYGSASFQYLSLFLILCGCAMVFWGASFFVRHFWSCLLVAIGLYPSLIFVTHKIWKLTTPPYILENLTGNLAGRALGWIGQEVTVQGRFIATGDGAVEVAPGCSGFEMAISIAAVGLLLGLFFKQKWSRIAIAIGVGVVLALLINIPRVMLLAYIVGYQDQSAFDFWHGPWGGQVFMAFLFTPYYYLAMAIFNNKRVSE